MTIRNSMRVLRIGRSRDGIKTSASSKLSVVLTLLMLAILVGPVMVSTRSGEGKAAAQPAAPGSPQTQGQTTRPTGTRRQVPRRVRPATSNANSNNANGNQIANANGNTNGNINRNSNANSNANGNGNANRTQDVLRFKGLKAAAGISRGVIAGGMVKLELSAPIPTEGSLQISVKPIAEEQKTDPAKPAEAPKETLLRIQDFLDKEVIARVPQDLPSGTYEVTISSQDPTNQPIKLQRPHLLYVEHLERILWYSLIPILAIAVIIVWISTRYKPAEGQTRYNVFQLLFLESKTQTYSLARTQFVLWVCAIASAYVFLFFARGLVEDIWAFPPLAGFGITFLISLGTLVAAQATDSAKGSKGAGAVDPSIADLFLHGGVLALDRVQQILWTVIAIGMFLWVVVKNYAISTELPSVPNELLYLMGISSGGYSVGKMVRKPGPIVTQILAGPGSVYLTIRGEHLSREAFVWVDGRQLTDKAAVSSADPDKPNEFAKELKVKLSDDASLTQWYSQDHNVLVVNSDSQRAEWRSTPAIENVEADANVQLEGNVILTIKGAYIGPDATWEVTGASFFRDSRPKPTSYPKEWLVTIIPADKKQMSGELAVQTPAGRASHTWAVTQ